MIVCHYGPGSYTRLSAGTSQESISSASIYLDDYQTATWYDPKYGRTCISLIKPRNEYTLSELKDLFDSVYVKKNVYGRIVLEKVKP